MKCEKQSIKSNSSIECSECHKRIHFTCSRLRLKKDFVQFKKSKEQFVCQFCSDYTCLKCHKHVYYGQKYGNNSEEPWYCRMCNANMLPFYNLSNNKFLNFIESNNNILLPSDQTFKKVIACSSCNSKNKKKNKKKNA